MDQVPGTSQPSVSELRRERERGEMTERIMNVAREMFVRSGYEEVSLRKVAKAIEYSPGTIYQYFRDKQALFSAIMQADSQDLRENLLECMKLDDPIERLNEMGRRYVDWGIAHPNHYRLMLVPPPAWAEQEEPLEEEHTPLEQEALFALNSIVKDAMKRGMIKEKYTDPALIAATLWAGIHGTLLLELTLEPKVRALLGGKDTSFQARFETIMEAFRDGFLKDNV